MVKGLIEGMGIFIPVHDLEVATEWYQNVLEFEIIHSDAPYANVVKMGDGTVVFCLLKTREVNINPFPDNDYGVDHYYNFHTNDIKQLHEKLVARGANVSKIDEFDGMSGFELYDPSGNRFSVVQ